MIENRTDMSLAVYVYKFRDGQKAERACFVGFAPPNEAHELIDARDGCAGIDRFYVITRTV